MPAKTAPVSAKKTGKVKDDYVREIDGVEIRLPSLSYLKPGLIRRLRRLGEIDAMYTLIEEAVSPAALEVLDDMDPDDYEEFLGGWRDHSGVSLGES